MAYKYDEVVQKIISSLSNIPLEVVSKLKRLKRKEFIKSITGNILVKDIENLIKKDLKEEWRSNLESIYFGTCKVRDARDVIFKASWDLQDDISWLKVRNSLVKQTRRLHDYQETDGYRDAVGIGISELIDILEIERQNIARDIDINLRGMSSTFQSCKEDEMIFLQDTFKEEVCWDLHSLTQEEKEFLLYLEKVHFKKDKPRGAEKNLFLTPEMQAQRVVTNDSYTCQICNGGDTGENNSIVFCSGCSVTIHQKCYGLNEIPPNEWVCNLCTTFKENGRYLRCPLCTRRGGVMRASTLSANSEWLKRQNGDFGRRSVRRGGGGGETGREEREVECDGEKYREFHAKLLYNYFKEPHEYESKHVLPASLLASQEPHPEKAWVHLTCAYWVPGVFLDFTSGLVKGFELVTLDLDKIDVQRFKLHCQICGECIIC